MFSGLRPLSGLLIIIIIIIIIESILIGISWWPTICYFNFYISLREPLSLANKTIFHFAVNTKKMIRRAYNPKNPKIFTRKETVI